MTEKEMIRRLKFKFVDYKMIPNVYYFGWESDLLLITNSDYVWEIEVKLTRSDFFADFKKQVPIRKKTGKGYHFVGYAKKHDIIQDKLCNDNLKPNKFIFAVPQGLISANEMPENYGLIEYEKPIIDYTVKPKILNKNNALNYKLLFNKIYTRYETIDRRNMLTKNF